LNFTIYSSDKIENLPITFFLKEGDDNIGKIEFDIDNNKPYYEISDSFSLKGLKASDASFYLKLILENINEI
jgi:hypothetical protein